MDGSELIVTARMARLTLSPDEQEKLGAAVEQMLAHFSHMKEIDVQGLAPTTHALLRENRLRDDVENRIDVTEKLLENAPEREERFIVIPNVPTLVCDVCGEKVFDRETLSRLSGLLGQSRAHARNVSPRHSWP